MEFELTPQAKALVKQYGIDEEELKEWKKRKFSRIGGENVQDFMIEKVEGNL